MPHARNIKPGVIKNPELGALPPLTRLCFINMWMVADYKGCIKYKKTYLKMEIAPYDKCNIDKIVSELEAAGFIKIYTIDCQKYIKIVNFEKHQNPHPKEKKTGSSIPDMPCNGIELAENRSTNSTTGTDQFPINSVELLINSETSSTGAGLKPKSNGKSAEIPLPATGEPGGFWILDSGFLLSNEKTLESSGEKNEACKKNNAQKNARASRLPADWQPTQEQIEYCRKERPDLDPEKLADKFRDYWIAVPGKQGTKTNWQATWRNFVRNERKIFNGLSAGYESKKDQNRQTTLAGLTGKNHGRSIIDITPNPDIPSLELD